MIRKVQRSGYRRDAFDARDHSYVPSGVSLPAAVDLRSKFPACWDQGQLGSCTAFGITGVIAFLHGFVGSQLWLYYKERVIERSTKQDAGAEIRDGIKVVAKQGLPPEAAWPYDVTKFRKAPPAVANKAATGELVTEYQRLTGLADYLDCLASGFPIVLGSTLYPAFESDEVAHTGVVPMPRPGEKPIGGHCFDVVGYDSSTRMFLCRNSWGEDWGRNGYFTMPFDYIGDPKLTDDAWVVKAAGA
jgi:C1A family cysteine protease